jgi:hypothetical protein
MLQRIQTIYLLLALLSIAGLAFAPVIRYENIDLKFVRDLAAWDVKHFYKGYFIFINIISLGISAGLILLSIFLYKKRGLQSALALLAILPVLTVESYVLYFFQTKESSMDMLYTAWNLVAILPVVFLLLAYRGIRKDEELIKGLDRLR